VNALYAVGFSYHSTESKLIMATNKPAVKNEPSDAPVRAARTGAMQSGITFTKKKSVTVPVLKLMPDQPAYIMVESAMQISKQIEVKKVGDKPMEPATIMHCTDLNTDSECILIVGKMLASVINETYPTGDYVGKCFEVINHGKRGDKKYNAYSLTEIEVD
jgi:hypothetical protein